MRNIIKASAVLGLLLLGAAFQLPAQFTRTADPGADLSRDLRQAQQDQQQVSRDVDALLRRLDDSVFANRLAQALRASDARAATELVQSTARSRVEVEIVPPAASCSRPNGQGGGNPNARGYICWHANGVKHCLINRIDACGL